MTGSSDERARRLAEQLRANLARRKGQRRARAADTVEATKADTDDATNAAEHRDD